MLLAHTRLGGARRRAPLLFSGRAALSSAASSGAMTCVASCCVLRAWTRVRKRHPLHPHTPDGKKQAAQVAAALPSPFPMSGKAAVSTSASSACPSRSR